MPTTVRLRPLPGHIPWGSSRGSPQEDMGCEWMDYKMTVVTADGLRDAIDFIDAHTSRHSECIVAEDEAAVAAFLREVDAACVYANVSTAFTDGGQFWLRSRNRHIYPEAARTRPDGSPRNHYLQVSRDRRRPDSVVDPGAR